MGSYVHMVVVYEFKDFRHVLKFVRTKLILKTEEPYFYYLLPQSSRLNISLICRYNVLGKVNLLTYLTMSDKLYIVFMIGRESIENQHKIPKSDC